MVSSRNLIYALHRDNSGSSTINAAIRDGMTFETHVFPFQNALVLVYRYLAGNDGCHSKGDMSWELIKATNGKVNSYSSTSIFLDGYHTPETVAKVVKEKFELIDGDEVD